MRVFCRAVSMVSLPGVKADIFFCQSDSGICGDLYYR